jgi:hypothetical protein
MPSAGVWEHPCSREIPFRANFPGESASGLTHFPRSPDWKVDFRMPVTHHGCADEAKPIHAAFCLNEVPLS